MSQSIEAIVYVHGISQHDIGYSDAWYDALRPHLDRPLQKNEVRWSDLVNVALKMDTEADAAKLGEEEQLRQQIQAELEARKVRNGQITPPVTGRNADKQYQAMAFALDDFVRYMVWESTRNNILSRFDEVVIPMLDGGRTIHVVAHSWGTVVSYEGLRRLDNQQFPGRVANLIVLGSALSIGAVQHNLFGRLPDGRLPQVVDSFVNVDAGGDIVGGNIAPPFDITEQFLNQKPTGCSMFCFRRLFGQYTAKNPFCAHSSYFHSQNLAVNRDIIAHYINQKTA